MLPVFCQIQGKEVETERKKTHRGVRRDIGGEKGRRRKHAAENQMSACCSLKSRERGSGTPAEGNRVLFR